MRAREWRVLGSGWCGKIVLMYAAVMMLPVGMLGSIESVGAGSYTTVFPGVDIAGRNSFPSGTPQLSGAALGRPVPTNDWWSRVVKEDHAGNLFNYPLGMRTWPRGLEIGYVVPGSGPNGSVSPLTDQTPVVVGVNGLTASRVTVSDHSDWTVTMSWRSGEHEFWATSGVGMPMVYFEKTSGSVARVEVNWGTVTIAGERLLIAGSQGGANFAVYGPAGTVWARSGNIYTSDLAGKNYWTLAKLPLGQPVAAAAEAYAAHAFAFPVGTEVEWHYDEATSVLRVDYRIETEVKEGTEDRIVQGLLPHQWAWLGAGSARPTGAEYFSVRGQLKMLIGNHFYTERKFAGILPTLPFLPGGSDSFRLSEQISKVRALQNEALSTWTDSYNEGQVMNRLIQTARVADLIGETEARDRMLATVKERLEDWLTASPGEVAFLFYYNVTWSALIGYPAGHGQDSNLNDHHFHWGYFIHAAAFLEQFEPGWAAQWGPMIHELIRDAGNPSRTDPKYPFLRNFSPYAGHSWANGFASFPQGNDQESTSESMQFNSSLIHWGAVTGDRAIRDLGIYLYVTEQSAIEEYWLDIHQRNFRPEYQYALASRVWGNGYDNGTFWTTDIAATYGIELYPIHGGSLYLGHDLDYARRLWNEMAANTGILSNQANDNLWHDVYWKFLAFIDAPKALQLYDSYPERNLKFGVSDAQTYHWLHAMNALGPVNAAITADNPLAAVFGSGSNLTYVAHNYAADDVVVTFSDGTQLPVPARSMATSRDADVAGVLQVGEMLTSVGGSIHASISITRGNADYVEFVLDDGVYATLTTAPFEATIQHLAAGVRSLHARVYSGDSFNITNTVQIIVGQQQPYEGQPWMIPGTIEAAKYDRFEGGSGQGIAYNDTTPVNAGTFRTEESVDATIVTGEGAVVGWTVAGEWLEYTVQVAQSGIYQLSFRYASGNAQARGPVRFLLNGRPITEPVALAATGGWSTYRDAVVEEVELTAGTRVLRLEFIGGEVNIGRLSFSYVRELPEGRPVADAGSTVFVRWPAAMAQLDGSGSSVAEGLTPQFTWTQVFGPSAALFSDPTTAMPTVSGLVEGIYRFQLSVSDGEWFDSAEVTLVVSTLTAFPPLVSLSRPANDSSQPLGLPIRMSASASDLDGEIAHVAFYNGSVRVGTAWTAPYTFDWTPHLQGIYPITAVAYDNDGLASVSRTALVTVEPAVPCEVTAANGDFRYAFTRNDNGEHFITFIPLRTGVGNPTCILYLSTTGSAPFPGMIITPNVPFRLSGSTGQTVYFYFTYTHPSGGERNTMGSIATHTLGICGEPQAPTIAEALAAWRAAYFSPAILNDPGAESIWGDHADPDGDGFPNLMEFWLGSDPFVADDRLMVVGQSDAGRPMLAFPVRRGLANDAIIALWSNDLVTWHGDEMSRTVMELDSAVDVIEVSAPGGSHTFFRLHIGPQP